MKIINNLFLTEIIFDDSTSEDESIPGNIYWLRCAIELDNVEAFWCCNFPGQEEEAFNCTKIKSRSNEEYFCKIEFSKFLDGYTKWKQSAKIFKTVN